MTADDERAIEFKRRFGRGTCVVFGTLTAILLVVSFCHLASPKANVLCYIGSFFSMWIALRGYFYARSQEE